MENHPQDEELKAHLSASHDEFRRLADRHAQLERELADIEAKPHVTEADELEEQHLKKLKLSVKDQMNQIMAAHRHTAVAAR